MTDSVDSGRAVGLLTITTELTEHEYRIELAGKLDLANADAVDAELQRAEVTRIGAIVLDLSQLEFMDSTGVALLLRASQRSSLDSDRLTIVRPPKSVMRVLYLTGADQLLPLAD